MPPIKTSMYWLLYLCSAVCVAGVLVFFPKRDWVALVGYMLTIFWMLIVSGYRGIVRAQTNSINTLKVIAESALEQLESEKNRGLEKK